MPLTTGYWVKHFNSMALLRYMERLSAKKMSIWSMEGLTFLKMNPQHLFKGIADSFFTYFQLLADTNNFFFMLY